MQANSQNVSQQISSSLNKLIDLSSFKCQCNNQALTVCINQKCNSSSNPFTCLQPQCQCSLLHENCQQKSLKTFLKIFGQNKKLLTEMEKTINHEIDQIIDQISNLRDQMLKKIRQGFSQQLKNTNNQKINQNQGKQPDNDPKQSISFYDLQIFKQALQKKQINGSITQAIWISHKIKKQNNYLESTIKNIQETTDTLAEQIQIYFKQIQLIFINEQKQNACLSVKNQDQKFKNKYAGKVFWSQTLKGNNQIINGMHVKKKTSYQDRFALLEPSINKMKATTLSWRIRIINGTSWVAVGICLQRPLMQNKYDFLNYNQANHGCYIISSNGYAWAHKVPQHNHKNDLSFSFQTNDIISLTLNLDKEQLKFQKQNSDKAYTMKLMNKKQLIKDQIHICIATYMKDDQIQLLPPVKTNVGNFEKKN